MSFSFNSSGVKADLIKTIDANASLPSQIKDYLKAGVEAHSDDANVSVSAYGHLFNGESGNYPVTLATIEVKAVPVENAEVPETAEQSVRRAEVEQASKDEHSPTSTVA